MSIEISGLQYTPKIVAEIGCNHKGEVDVAKEMIKVAETGKYLFLSNVKNRTFPKGMSVEIVEMDYYRKWLPVILKDEYYREHVMVSYDSLRAE